MFTLRDIKLLHAYRRLPGPHMWTHPKDVAALELSIRVRNELDYTTHAGGCSNVNVIGRRYMDIDGRTLVPREEVVECGCRG